MRDAVLRELESMGISEPSFRFCIAWNLGALVL